MIRAVGDQLRAVCDQFGSYRSFVRRLQELPTMTSFFAHVVGVRPQEHVVVQGFGREFATRKFEDARLIKTNHFVPAEFEPYNPACEEWTDRDGREWMLDSRPRYQALERRLTRLPRSLNEALGKLRRQPVTNENTMQTMAFCPARGKWRLKVQT